MSKLSKSTCFVGVDVGTGSVRAGVFDDTGHLLGSSTSSISIRQPEPGHFEQSSEEIWRACCTSVRQALRQSSRSSEDVAGIAFDATCSLVIQGNVPLSVGHDLPDDVPCRSGAGYDIIMWCDHRATQEASMINESKHRLLDFVGGKVFPEMELPKLAWLKKYRPDTYAAATHFYDLADYLLHRASDFGGETAAGIRSQCTVVCKWNFDAEKRDWAPDFFEMSGLGDLQTSKIGKGSDVKGLGSAVSLGQKAAADLGLSKSTTLGVGAIDAHAGGLGCLGAAPADSWPPLEARMALIAGTSACHMTSSSKAFQIPGVWGPFDSAMVPGLFLHEAGQSAAGAALDYVMETHPSFPALEKKASAAGAKPADFLCEHILALAKQRNTSQVSFLTRGIFVGPDLNGNRSPLADPSLRGSIIGLGPAGDNMRATSIDALAVLYLAMVQALSYSTRAIVDTINSSRAREGITAIHAVHVCGGLAQNSLYLQEHCDVLGLPFCCTDNPGADVIRGSAMLAATASGEFQSVYEAMRGMSQTGKLLEPTSDITLKEYHKARYEIFLRMQREQQEYNSIESQVFEAHAKRIKRPRFWYDTEKKNTLQRHRCGIKSSCCSRCWNRESFHHLSPSSNNFALCTPGTSRRASKNRGEVTWQKLSRMIRIQACCRQQHSWEFSWIFCMEYACWHVQVFCGNIRAIGGKIGASCTQPELKRSWINDNDEANVFDILWSVPDQRRYDALCRTVFFGIQSWLASKEFGRNDDIWSRDSRLGPLLKWKCDTAALLSLILLNVQVQTINLCHPVISFHKTLDL